MLYSHMQTYSIMKLREWSGPVVMFYHNDCVDGFASATLLAKTILDIGSKDTEGNPCEVFYYPKPYGTEIQHKQYLNCEDAIVFFLDITPSHDEYDELTGCASALCVIDHHSDAIKSFYTKITPEYTSYPDKFLSYYISDSYGNSATNLVFKLLIEIFYTNKEYFSRYKEAVDVISQLDTYSFAGCGVREKEDLLNASYWLMNQPKVMFGGYDELLLLSRESLTNKGVAVFPHYVDEIFGAVFGSYGGRRGADNLFVVVAAARSLRNGVADMFMHRYTKMSFVVVWSVAVEDGKQTLLLSFRTAEDRDSSGLMIELAVETCAAIARRTSDDYDQTLTSAGGHPNAAGGSIFNFKGKSTASDVVNGVKDAIYTFHSTNHTTKWLTLP